MLPNSLSDLSFFGKRRSYSVQEEKVSSFGKYIPGTKRRGYRCVVLEASEMIAIDYPEMMSMQTAGETSRSHALRRTSLDNTMDNNAECETSSSEVSPAHGCHHAMQGVDGEGSVVMSDNISQLSFSKDMEEDDYDVDEDDTISLHSVSSLFIKDLVIDVLKKEIEDRNNEDLEILMEFTKSLRAFSNMTEPIRRSLCKVMVFAWIEHADTIVLRDNELLDSWSVIINGQVQVVTENDLKILGMGDSFGVKPTLQAQQQKGTMTTMCEDCQFFCIAQQDYYDVLHQGQENIENITNEDGEIVMVKEKREIENGDKKGNIAIRGTADSLMKHMLDENAIDPTYIEDFLLTYRVFDDDPLKMCTKLLEWFDVFRDKVIKIFLLWVNNHFKDFEADWRMMDLLEKFDEKLQQGNLPGQTKLFNIAVSAKAKPRIVQMNRGSSDSELGFDIVGGSDQEYRNPIFVCKVVSGSLAEESGVKRGDQLLEVNGQNFEKISLDKAQTLLKKNTDLSLTLKTNLFAFKELIAELKNPTPKVKKQANGLDRPHTLRVPTISTSSEGELYDKHSKKGGTIGRASRKISRFFKKDSSAFNDYLIQHRDTVCGADERAATTMDGSRRVNRHASTFSHSAPNLCNFATYSSAEAPDSVIKVYRGDQSFHFIYVSKDTTAGDALRSACREFGITDEIKNFALYKVSVQGENFVKQSKLPDPLSKLADMPLGSRYYLKNTMNSEQLLPDENIPELLKEANFNFLDLNCYEIAFYLTREDYLLFKQTEPSNYIDDLFNRGTELGNFKEFEDLVNRELFWVVTTICSEPSIVQRAKIIKHFIKIAHHCKLLRNFNSTFALVSGLGYRAVSKMKLTWEKVPAKSIRLFEELQALMDPSRNMSKYRTLLSEHVHQPPVIPYIPVVKKDLTFLHLGNDTNVDGLVNFEKMRMLSKEVRNICRMCVPDASQIQPLDIGTLKDNENAALYKTLTRKNRRGSLNNARRMYEDTINARRVRQYMQQIKVETDEVKLMEMSKIVESPQALASQTQKRRNTSANVLNGSPARSTKSAGSTLTRADSNGYASTAQARAHLESHFARILAAQQSIKKKTPYSTLPNFAIDSNSSQLVEQKINSDGLNNNIPGKDVRRSLSMSGPELSSHRPKHQQNQDENNDDNSAIGLENLNLNNNRHDLVSSDSCASLDSVNPRTLGRLNVPRSSKSSASSGRGSFVSSTGLSSVSTSNPTISELGSDPSPHNSPISRESRKSQSNTAPPNLMNPNQKSFAKPQVVLTAADLAMCSDSFQICGDESMVSHNVMKQAVKNRLVSTKSSPIISMNEPQGDFDSVPLARSTSSDSGIETVDGVLTGSGQTSDEQASLATQHLSAPPTARGNLPSRRTSHLHPFSSEDSASLIGPDVIQQISEECFDDVPEEGCSPDLNDALPTADRRPPLPPATFGPNQCSGYDEDTTLTRRNVSSSSQTQSNRPNFFGRKAMKGIHDFVCERHGILPNRLPHAPMSYPFMQPNYTRNVPHSATSALREEQLILQLNRQNYLNRYNHNHVQGSLTQVNRYEQSPQPSYNLPTPPVETFEDPRNPSSLLYLQHSNVPSYNVYVPDGAIVDTRYPGYMNCPENGESLTRTNSGSLRRKGLYANLPVIDRAQRAGPQPRVSHLHSNTLPSRRRETPPPPPPPPLRSSINRILERQSVINQHSIHVQDRQGPALNPSPSRSSRSSSTSSDDHALHNLRSDFRSGRHLVRSEAFEDRPPPPPKRTTSIGRPHQIRSNIDTSPTSPNFRCTSPCTIPKPICEEDEYLPFATSDITSPQSCAGFIPAVSRSYRHMPPVQDDFFHANAKLTSAMDTVIPNSYERYPGSKAGSRGSLERGSKV